MSEASVNRTLQQAWNYAKAILEDRASHEAPTNRAVVEDYISILSHALIAPSGQSAGDLLCLAVHRWGLHGMACEADPCAECDACFNQVRLVWKVWINSAHKIVQPSRSQELLRELGLTTLPLRPHALIATSGETRWQPIASAPKEGAILAADEYGDVQMVYWDTTADGQRKGWFNGRQWLVHPTHWMPLPEPPSLLSQAITVPRQDEGEYWSRALGLVADDLATCSTDRFEDKRQKWVAVLRNAAHRAAVQPSTETTETPAEASQEKSWRCFWCGMVLTTEHGAVQHFGTRKDGAELAACEVANHPVTLEWRRRATIAEWKLAHPESRADNLMTTIVINDGIATEHTFKRTLPDPGCPELDQLTPIPAPAASPQEKDPPR